MKAEILAVGTELLMGQITNTNAQYISSKLPLVGVGVYYHTVVGDNAERLETSLSLALERCDVVITTGGLGPTQDDLTKETVASLMGKKLVLHQESLTKIKCFFENLHRSMTINNEKQAYFPEGCIIMKNNNGTAPGCIIENGEKVVIMLPGPPSEMKPMFDEQVMPYFMKKCDFKLESKFLRVFGIGESALEDMLLDLIDGQTNPTLATYAKDGEVTLRLTARVNPGENADDIISPMLSEIKKRTGDALYSLEDEPLDLVAAKLLMERNITIATAESCTGGLVSEILTNVPGISKVFMGGSVTYSNQSKSDLLGVKEETLSKYGAVSKQTAAEMAEGIRKKLATDIAVSVTGIAGPDGGTAEKPVGLVFVALASKDGTVIKQLNLWGSRNRIRNVTALHVFDMIRRHVLGLEIN